MLDYLTERMEVRNDTIFLSQPVVVICNMDGNSDPCFCFERIDTSSTTIVYLKTGGNGGIYAIDSTSNGETKK